MAGYSKTPLWKKLGVHPGDKLLLLDPPPGWGVPALPEGVRTEAVLDTLPGKKPLIKLTYRPPNYETPIEHFRTAITPNDAFFVRYHLADIPEVDAKTWKVALGGDGANGQGHLQRRTGAVPET